MVSKKTEEVVVEPASNRSQWFTRKSYWYNCGIVKENSLRYFEIPDVKVEIKENDLRYIVKAGEEGRLDLISYKYYKTCDYWWVIAIANDIYFPFDFTAGDVLIIPEKIYIENEVLRLV